MKQRKVRGLQNRGKLALTAINEAHLFHSWRDFLGAYKQLESLKHHFSDTPIMALTATVPPEVITFKIMNSLPLSERAQSSADLSSCTDPSRRAGILFSSRFCTWSCIRLMLGVTTITFLFSWTAGNWKQRDLTLPVGCTTIVSPPEITLSAAFFW